VVFETIQRQTILGLAAASPNVPWLQNWLLSFFRIFKETGMADLLTLDEDFESWFMATTIAAAEKKASGLTPPEQVGRGADRLAVVANAFLNPHMDVSAWNPWWNALAAADHIPVENPAFMSTARNLSFVTDSENYQFDCDQAPAIVEAIATWDETNSDPPACSPRLDGVTPENLLMLLSHWQAAKTTASLASFYEDEKSIHLGRRPCFAVEQPVAGLTGARVLIWARAGNAGFSVSGGDAAQPRVELHAVDFLAIHVGLRNLLIDCDTDIVTAMVDWLLAFDHPRHHEWRPIAALLLETLCCAPTTGTVVALTLASRLCIQAYNAPRVAAKVAAMSAQWTHSRV
jgi:hypothetical protein